jgi:predicted DNA-binding transcriptional regulator YafY
MNRGSIRRIQKIDSMIRLGKMRSAQQLAEEFEVSRRTIERDIEMLRLELGAEVVYNRAKGSYEYKGKPLPLPGQWLNEREIAITLIAERALRMYTGGASSSSKEETYPFGYAQGSSFSDEIHPVFNKLLNPIRDDKKAMDYIKDLAKSVYFFRPFQPLRDLRTEFSVVLNSIMERKRMSMLYQTAGMGKTGDLRRRELEPYVLLNNGGDWYAVGECRQSHTIKTFSLGRVFEPRLEDHYFDIPDSFKIQDYLSSGFGRMKGAASASSKEGRMKGDGASTYPKGYKPVKVRLRVTPPASAWIAGSKWHSSQTIKQNRDSSIVLTMTCPITDTLVRWILQMAGNVKVLAPKQLRELVFKQAMELAGNNS